MVARGSDFLGMRPGVASSAKSVNILKKLLVKVSKKLDYIQLVANCIAKQQE